MDKFIGKRLDGRYEIVELIGAGGMANVYKAVDRLENREVAVKILREEFLSNEDFVRRFKNESKAIGLLSHQNIVKVYDVNFSDSVQYIVMELIRGMTLKQFMEKKGQLTWKDSVFFTEQILRALQHAHDRGIIHRDIKPQNIMILKDGTIKVMDFGIARFSRSDTRTITDKAIGSVHYISPEQAKGDATDAKADIYSVGVMLYEMLTGKLPFESDSPVSVAIKQISDAPTSPRRINPGIPEALEEITLKAMAKDTAKRYQSAALMLRDIEDFKKNPSIKFEYKYLNDDSATKYIDLPDSLKSKTSKSGAKTKKGAPPKKKKGNAAIAIMLGVTLACIIGSLVLIYMVFSLGDNALFVEKVDVDLPDFVGQSYADIVNNKSYKFNFGVEENYNNEYGIGVVYDQSPVPPKTIKEDGRVTLYVSKGTEVVTVPNVVGWSNGEAVTALQNLGLAVKIEIQQDENYDDNVVIRTDPVPGTEIDSGSIVTAYINSNMAVLTVTVPNVVGLNYNLAKTTLQSNGLKLGSYTEKESELEKGTVIEQSPSANVKTTQGSSVSVVISSGITKKDVMVNVALPLSVNGITTYDLVARVNGAVVQSASGASQATGWIFTLNGSATDTVALYAVAGGSEYSIATLTVNYQSNKAAQVNVNNATIVWALPTPEPTPTPTPDPGPTT